MGFREVRECPGSITDLSQRLHRDRSAVKRDIDELERIGLVEVEDMPLRNEKLARMESLLNALERTEGALPL